jgi:hypothetical protein
MDEQTDPSDDTTDLNPEEMTTDLIETITDALAQPTVGPMMGASPFATDDIEETPESVTIARDSVTCAHALDRIADHIEDTDIDFHDHPVDVRTQDIDRRMVMFGISTLGPPIERLCAAINNSDDDSDDDNPFTVSDGDDPIY